MKNQIKSTSSAATRLLGLLRNNDFELVPAIVKMLAEGSPIQIKDLSLRTGWNEERIVQNLSNHPSIEYDDQGRIIGFGLTLRPTLHRFDFNQKTVYGWCASDVLMFPLLIGVSGVVSSTCPVTKKKIKIKLSPNAVLDVDPSETVLSLVRPVAKVDDVRSNVCSVGLFYSSREVALEWLAAHPEGFLHTVQEDFEINREVIDQIGWTDEKNCC